MYLESNKLTLIISKMENNLKIRNSLDKINPIIPAYISGADIAHK